MNAELNKLTELSRWYKNLKDNTKSEIISLFELFAKNEEEFDGSGIDIDEEEVENIDELCFFVWNSLDKKSNEEVIEELIENEFDEILSKLIVDYVSKRPSSKKDANLMRSLDDLEFKHVIKLTFYDVFLKGDIDSWDYFIKTSKIKSEVAEATYRFIILLSKKVCYREFGIKRLLIEEYGFTELQKNFLMSLIRENIDEIEKILLFKSIGNINESIKEIQNDINYLLGEIEK